MSPTEQEQESHILGVSLSPGDGWGDGGLDGAQARVSGRRRRRVGNMARGGWKGLDHWVWMIMCNTGWEEGCCEPLRAKAAPLSRDN